MFANEALAARIEHAEARLTVALARGVIAPPSLIQPIGGGIAAFARPGSPMNKVIGLGFNGEVEDAALSTVETSWRERGEAVRVELSTLAAPAVGAQLSARGYRLIGFENVLGLSLVGREAEPGHAIAVEVVDASNDTAWKETLITGFSHPDGTGVTAETTPRELLEPVMEDFRRAVGLTRCLARIGGVPAGAATLRIDAGVAQLCGATTLPQFRRRGAQRAMLEARLALAKAAGCDVAVVTTAPGSQSHANAHRQGFALLYARAVLVRPWG